MTAEIAVLNKSAVALAADSLVTIERQGQPPKTYEVNKMFTLSRYAPVGCMIYGAANILGVPWETVIKVYRRSLGKTKFDTVRQYCDSLTRFLENSRELFPRKRQDRYFSDIVGAFFHFVNLTIDNAVKTQHGEDKPISASDVERITAETIQGLFERFSKKERREGLGDGFEENISAAYKSQVGDLVQAALGKKPLGSAALEQLHSLSVMIFVKDHPLPIGESGIVIAGFGEQEFFPVLRTHRVYGILCDHLIHSFSEDDSCEHENGCGVLPFAQRDVADSFLQGIDNHQIGILTKYVGLVIRSLCDTFAGAVNIPDEEKSTLTDKLKDASGIALDGFRERIRKHLREWHIDPLLETVNVLPKEELAVLAEALVNLTAIKRKIQRDTPTVGGPIDVAVISKGDGFVWIKRKHYFDASINPGFLKGYLDR